MKTDMCLLHRRYFILNDVALSPPIKAFPTCSCNFLSLLEGKTFNEREKERREMKMNDYLCLYCYKKKESE